MRIRRHLPPLAEWKLPWLTAPRTQRWGLALVSAVLAGYLTAYLLLFPAPLLHGRQVVPHVLGLSLSEASEQLRKAGLQVQDGGAEPHPTAPQGTVIWQDPPPGVSAQPSTTLAASSAKAAVLFLRITPSQPGRSPA